MTLTDILLLTRVVAENRIDWSAVGRGEGAAAQRLTLRGLLKRHPKHRHLIQATPRARVVLQHCAKFLWEITTHPDDEVVYEVSIRAQPYK